MNYSVSGALHNGVLLLCGGFSLVLKDSVGSPHSSTPTQLYPLVSNVCGGPRVLGS